MVALNLENIFPYYLSKIYLQFFLAKFGGPQNSNWLLFLFPKKFWLLTIIGGLFPFPELFN